MEQSNTTLHARLTWIERILNTMSGIVYIYNTVEQRNVYANRNMGAFLGYTQEELQEMGSSVLATIMHPDDLVHLTELIGRIAAAADNEVVTNEYRLHSAAGEWIWFQDYTTVFSRDAQGNVVEFVGVLQDITERKQQEAERRQLVSIVENSADFIGSSSLNGQVLYLNKAGRDLVGLNSEADVQQTQIIDYIHPDEQIRVQQDILPIIFRGGYWKGETVFRHFTTGERIPVEWNVFLIRNPATGQPVSVGTVTRDMREQKRAEEERATLQQLIIDTQRDTLRELSTPLIPIAHTVVIMPLIGTIDSQRAQQIMETLLEGVAQQQATLAILDITGVQVVDTQVADALIRAAQAVRLLGAQMMLTGIQPQIAQTLVQLGVDLSGIITRGSLQAGIATAFYERNET